MGRCTNVISFFVERFPLKLLERNTLEAPYLHKIEQDTPV